MNHFYIPVIGKPSRSFEYETYKAMVEELTNGSSPETLDPDMLAEAEAYSHRVRRRAICSWIRDSHQGSANEWHEKLRRKE